MAGATHRVMEMEEVMKSLPPILSRTGDVPLAIKDDASQGGYDNQLCLPKTEGSEVIFELKNVSLKTPFGSR